MKKHSLYPWLKINRSLRSKTRAKMRIPYSLYVIRFSYKGLPYIKCGVSKSMRNRLITFSSVVDDVILLYSTPFECEYDAVQAEHQLMTTNDRLGFNAGLYRKFPGGSECYTEFHIRSRIFSASPDSSHT